MTADRKPMTPIDGVNQKLSELAFAIDALTTLWVERFGPLDEEGAIDFDLERRFEAIDESVAAGIGKLQEHMRAKMAAMSAQQAAQTGPEANPLHKRE